MFISDVDWLNFNSRVNLLVALFSYRLEKQVPQTEIKVYAALLETKRANCDARST